jgi:hypothetical protein
MITALPPFVRGVHYDATPLANYWFRLKHRVTIDLNMPIYGTVSFRDESHEWARLHDDALTIPAGYAWDGPTCALRLEKAMLPSLIHDVLYQFLSTPDMRDRIDRKKADLLFYHAMKANGFLLRGPYYQAVKRFGHLFIKEHNVHSVIIL